MCSGVDIGVEEEIEVAGLLDEVMTENMVRALEFLYVFLAASS
jgi:hypothetical protein